LASLVISLWRPRLTQFLSISFGNITPIDTKGYFDGFPAMGWACDNVCVLKHRVNSSKSKEPDKSVMGGKPGECGAGLG